MVVNLANGFSCKKCHIYLGVTISSDLRWNKPWFLQVRENWKKSEFEWSGKGQGKIFFLEKSGKMNEK